MARKARHRSCRPCKPCARRRKRKGSPRFSATCRAQFKSCMKGEVQETGSFKTAGRACMTALHQCQTKGSLGGRRRRRHRKAA